jgi:peptide/nickel transport system permease protein
MGEETPSLPAILTMPVERRERSRVGTSHGPWADAARRLRGNRTALLGALVLALVVGAALLAPVVAPRDPIRMDPARTLRAPSVGAPFGTDHLGRDVLSRVLHGGRLSLQVGVVSVGISLGWGLALGLLAGFSGGWRDTLIIRAMDVLLACPGVLLALAIVTVLGPGLRNVMIAVGLAHVPHYTRVVRSSVLSTTRTPYVDAARALGCGDARLVLGHVLPNALTPVIVVATLGIPTAIAVGAGFSFLGLGAQPPSPEWGAMVSSGREYLRRGWWISTAPGMMILLSVLAINLLGDGLREALDPVTKRD